MKSPFIFTLVLLSSAVSFSPALAQDIATSIVRTADLDLSSETGRRALEQRIHRAAREVCGTPSDADLEGKNAVRQCRTQVIADASAQRDQILASKRSATISVAAR